VMDSAADGLGMGIGFTLTLLVVGGIRELIGTGAIAGLTLLGPSYDPALIMILPPGAFLVLGSLIALMNFLQREKSS
jgi:electron transport complex protein RnfE